MPTVDDKKIIFSHGGSIENHPAKPKTDSEEHIPLVSSMDFKIGIISLNGAGKSTLMKIIAGLEQPRRVKWCGVRDIPWAICHRTRLSMNQNRQGECAGRRAEGVRQSARI